MSTQGVKMTTGYTLHVLKAEKRGEEETTTLQSRMELARKENHRKDNNRSTQQKG